MPRPRLVALVFALGLSAASACTPPSSPPAPTAPSPIPAGSQTVDASAPVARNLRDDDVKAFVDEYLTLLERISPESATPLGLHGHDTEVDSRDPEQIAKDLAEERALLAKIDAAIPVDAALGASARTDLALLRGVLRTELVRAERSPSPPRRSSTRARWARSSR